MCGELGLSLLLLPPKRQHSPLRTPKRVLELLHIVHIVLDRNGLHHTCRPKKKPSKQKSAHPFSPSPSSLLSLSSSFGHSPAQFTSTSSLSPPAFTYASLILRISSLDETLPCKTSIDPALETEERSDSTSRLVSSKESSRRPVMKTLAPLATTKEANQARGGKESARDESKGRERRGGNG